MTSIRFFIFTKLCHKNILKIPLIVAAHVFNICVIYIVSNLLSTYIAPDDKLSPVEPDADLITHHDLLAAVTSHNNTIANVLDAVNFQPAKAVTKGVASGEKETYSDDELLAKFASRR